MGCWMRFCINCPLYLCTCGKLETFVQLQEAEE